MSRTRALRLVLVLVFGVVKNGKVNAEGKVISRCKTLVTCKCCDRMVNMRVLLSLVNLFC